jgi:thiol-disulfide isomerase/thioredoxin
LLIELGGAFGPVVLRLTGNGFNGAGTLELFLVFSLMLGLSGIQTRRFIAAGRTRAAALVGSLTLGGAIVIVAGSIPALLAKLSNQHVNRPAPVFGFVSLDGKPVTSAELHGRVVVLAFWATWCQPCRQELPQLQELRARLKGTGEVEFWGIGGPWGEDTVAKESEYAKKLNLDLPLGFASDEAKKALGVELFPTLIILDKAGRVRVVHTGFDESEHLVPNLEGEVRALTREPSQGS